RAIAAADRTGAVVSATETVPVTVPEALAMKISGGISCSPRGWPGRSLDHPGLVRLLPVLRALLQLLGGPVQMLDTGLDVVEVAVDRGVVLAHRPVPEEAQRAARQLHLLQQRLHVAQV